MIRLIVQGSRSANDASDGPERVSLTLSEELITIPPDRVAAMALFLSSDLGASISGKAIAVDGHTETSSG